MPTVWIDEVACEFAEGELLLEVAARHGIAIPALCHAPGQPPLNSCMLCMVEEPASGRLVPACSEPARADARYRTDTPTVHEHRRDTLELLLAEHAGDCEGPCRLGCPAHMNIPRMIALLGAGRAVEALRVIREHIPLPATLGRICPAPCEKVCRRAPRDGAVAVCLLKRFAADAVAPDDPAGHPSRQPPSGRQVVVVGAGPAGLSAAYYLALAGHAVTLLEAAENAGGMPRAEASLRERLPFDALARDVAGILWAGVQLRTGVRVGSRTELAAHAGAYDALVLAPGGSASAADWDLPRDAHERVQYDRTTHAAGPGVYVAGAFARPMRMAVQAVADGRVAAVSADQYLRGLPVTGEHPAFHSHWGRARPEDEEAWLAWGRAAPRAIVPAHEGLSADAVRTEASRCYRCACLRADDCRLRDYSLAEGAKQHRWFSAQRPLPQRVALPGGTVYEPAKCVRCGRCVRLCETRGVGRGLTLRGRGFNLRIGMPLDYGFEELPDAVARELPDVCPTGALACGSGG